MSGGRLLGAVLAGGRSSRFGSDKAEALHAGRRLLDLSVAALALQADAVVVIGRTDPAYDCAPDVPGPGLGPLGGLAGALMEARRQGFHAVLSCAVDTVKLPDGLPALLLPAPAVIAKQPTIGLWPVSLLDVLLGFIETAPKRSLYAFAEHIDARFVASPATIPNVNRPADLAGLGN